MKLRELLNEADQPGKLFVVFYRVIGSRSNGSYLVNAKDAAHAKQIVKKLDPDYAQLTAMSPKKASGMYSMEDEKELLRGLELPTFGKVTHIESGT